MVYYIDLFVWKKKYIYILAIKVVEWTETAELIRTTTVWRKRWPGIITHLYESRRSQVVMSKERRLLYTKLLCLVQHFQLYNLFHVHSCWRNKTRSEVITLLLATVLERQAPPIHAKSLPGMNMGSLSLRNCRQLWSYYFIPGFVSSCTVHR